MLTIKEAAKQTGKVKQTILRSIKNGKLSAKKDEHGIYKIDPAELFRVYPPTQVHESVQVTSAHHEEETITAFPKEYQFLIQQLEERLLEKDQQLTEYKKLHQKAEEKREEAEVRYHALLTDQREKKPKGLIQRIFG